MTQFEREMDNLGRDIQEIVDRAINSKDFQKLNQNISKTVTDAVHFGSETVRKAVDSVQYTTVTPRRTAQVKRAEVVPPQARFPTLYGKTGNKETGAILKTVFGGILAFFSVIGTLGSAFMNLFIPGLIHFGLPGIVTLACGGLLIVSGVNTLRRIGRFKTYRRTLGDKTHCTIEKLARSVGKNVKTVRKELDQMIREGYFLEGHLNNEQTVLITSDETYELFEQSRLHLEQSQTAKAADPVKTGSHSAQVQEVLDRGDAFLVQIRQCNDAIPGEEISEKIYRIERIVERIFDRAEEHPEIVPDLKKLMDYYLPMTVKLLKAYADMDAQPIQGETIQNSKREIEATLDTLNFAFEKLLDDLFVETAIDVSSDISVLHTLLAQEGLTDDGISK